MRNEGKWSCKDPMVFTLYIKILVRNYRQTKTLGATFTILDWEYMKDIYIYTNIHTADEDVNMTAILALINITWAVVKIRPEKKKLQACTVHLTLCKRCVENSLDGAWRDVSLWRLKRFVAFFKFLPTKINLKKKTNKLYKFRIRQYPSVFLTCKWSHSL